MGFRLAVVGHRSSIDDIQWIATEKFDNVETIGVELANDEMVNDAARHLESLLPRVDGVLYTRREPYELLVSRVDHGSVPARFVDVDASSLVQGLLLAKLKFGADINRISIDTLDYQTVMRTYDSLEIPMADVHPTLVRVDIGADHFVEATAQTHSESYWGGLCTACLTNIRDVQETLLGLGIPSVLMTPSPETYIHEIRRLILHRQDHVDREARNAVLYICTEQKNEYLQQRNMVQNVLEAERIAELVVMTAQRVNGAFIREGNNSYVVICDYQALAEYTDGFTSVELLAKVYSETTQQLALGIGIGRSLQNALTRAQQACFRARSEGWNRGFLISEKGELIGPLQPNELLFTKKAEFDHQLTKVAADCGLSINTIMKIDNFARKKPNASFITAELGQELHVSFRTAARIVEKLEKHGYIVEMGRTAISDRGRPTRILRLLW